MQQSERESRRLWRHVTAALYRNKINIATSAKRWIEQRQRDEAKQRRGKWSCQYFDEEKCADGPSAWKYKYPLDRRLTGSSTSSS